MLILAILAAGPPCPTPYRLALPGTAWVRSGDGAQGTGWVADSRKRLLVTSCHAVADADAVEAVFYPGTTDRAELLVSLPGLRKKGLAVRGKVLRRDAGLDLALVELGSLPAGARELALSPTSPSVGERLHLVGCRHDLPVLWAHAGGEMRGVRRLPDGYPASGRDYGKAARLMQTSIPINQGDSGGPLVNARGQVVGVAAAVAPEAGGGGLFVSLADIAAFLKRVAPRPAAGGVIEKAMRATVLIASPGRPAFAGVVVGPGLVVTTAEAAAREKTVPVTFLRAGVFERDWYRANADVLRKKGLLVTGTVAASDEKSGLVLLSVAKMPAGVEPMKLGDMPGVGGALHVISHPARLERHWLYAAASVRGGDLILQAPCLDGEAGGPVFDAAGRLVGILSGKVGPQAQVVHAAPASALARLKKPEGIAWGRRLLEAREWARAREAFLTLLPSPERAAGVARSWRGEGHIDRALNTRDVPSVERAACLLERGEARKAVALLADAKEDAPALALRSLARRRLGDIKGADADAADAVWHGPTSALAALAKGDPGRALALDDRLGEAFLLRGERHWHAGKRAESLADYGRALDERPWDARALWGKARAGDDLAGMLTAAERLPAEAALWRDIASLAMQRGLWRRAGESLGRAARYGQMAAALERLEHAPADVADPAAALAMAAAFLGEKPETWEAARRLAAARRARLDDR